MDDIKIHLSGLQKIDNRLMYVIVTKWSHGIDYFEESQEVIMPLDTLDKLKSNTRYKEYNFLTFNKNGKYKEITINAEDIILYYPAYDANPIDWNAVGEWHI